MSKSDYSHTFDPKYLLSIFSGANNIQHRSFQQRCSNVRSIVGTLLEASLLEIHNKQ